ncbi:hypothetical protein SDC9_155241 [bioreactor metagenome]|uniref:Uncharacterized protein n=1 Tax=bioreactor metagenome TaxID=1076179 RepID=A0A645F2W4_9ZZZZ
MLFRSIKKEEHDYEKAIYGHSAHHLHGADHAADNGVCG